MKIVLLGSPGVGKGTYANVMKDKLGVPHISTGDLFRENIKKETDLGLRAKKYMDLGELVPDEITTGMLKERISGERGFLLDGYPRTIPQAESLAVMTEIDLVLNFVADDEVIIQRLSGRRICKKCGTIFHTVNLPPKKEGVCDSCGGELYQRDDDKPEAIKERLEIYREKTAPLVKYYQEKGLLHTVKVNEDFGTHREILLERIFKAIGGE
jgi:adenylate kinase